MGEVMQLYKQFVFVLIILSMSLICLFSCYKVTTRYDNIEGHIQNRMKGNSLAGTPFLSTASVYFNVQNTRPANGPDSYQIFIEHNIVKKKKVANKTQIGDDYYKVRTKNGNTKYPVPKKTDYVISSNLDWLFLEEKESLILIIDGERMAFKGKYGSVGYDESIIYEVTRQQLEKIASADNVRVKIIGEKD